MGDKGQAARNEKQKLEATYWNGLAIGATLAGAVIPLLTGYPALLDVLTRYSADGAWSGFDWRPLAIGGSVAALAYALAAYCRYRAERAAGLIED